MKLLNFIEKGALNEENNRTISYQWFGRESQAHMRYVHFVNQAKNEQLNNAARLFHAIAHAEYIHPGDHFEGLKHPRDDLSQIAWQFSAREIPRKILN